MKKLLLISILLLSILFLDAQVKRYSLSDLKQFAKNQYGFVQPNNDIDQYYGDIECVSQEEGIFEFNVGCGRGGDIVKLLVKENNVKPNYFDLFISKGDIYYGVISKIDKKVGELFVKSENEISGNLKLCLEKNASCCGDVGSNFLLKKIKNL